mgnify:CR=1 FL=1
MNSFNRTIYKLKEKNIFDCEICSVCNSNVINSCRSDGKDFKLSAAIISL